MLVMVSNRAEQVGDVVIVKPVVGVATRAADRDEASVPEQTQLVRRRARRDAGGFDELLHRALAAEHRPEQPQATAGTESSHCLREHLGLVDTQRAPGSLVFGRMWHRRLGYQLMISSSHVSNVGVRVARWVAVSAVVGGSALAAPGPA